MSQVIRISESIYKRLEAHAEGFDSPVNVIERLLNFYEKHHEETVTNPFQQQASSPIIIPTEDEIIELNPDNPGSLTHTRILQGQFGESKVKKWKELLYQAHRYALKRFGNFDDLESVTRSNIFKGERDDSGYHSYPDIGISIQCGDANNSWRSALKLAKSINEGVNLLIEWRHNENAAYPGRRGKLFYAPVPQKKRKPVPQTRIKPGSSTL